jgi:pimeloyl-ACP methyl ester carboxylesterase
LCRQLIGLFWLLVVFGRPSVSAAAEIVLKNGMRLRGQIAPLAQVGSDPLAAQTTVGQPIIVVDDGLRRTFVSVHQQDEVGPDQAVLRRIELPFQQVVRAGRAISTVGQILEATPFDRFGRRTVRLMTPRGPVAVVQGITEITPDYTKVEGLAADRSYQWDMRLATSSIDHDTLSTILYQAMDKDNANDRLAIVTFYIQSERYQDALDELQGAIRDFPELERLRQQQKELRQLKARQIVREIRLRRDAGQHQFVRKLLASFPGEDVAQAVLLEVEELAQEYDKADGQIERVRSLLAANLSALDDAGLRQRIEPVRAEIVAQINRGNLNRMADFLRLAEDASLGAEQKLSLAISAWLLGSGAGNENLAVSLSLLQVRELVGQYLRTRPDDKLARQEILQALTKLEGSQPSDIARLLASMKPPRALRPQAEAAEHRAPAASGPPPADSNQSGPTEDSLPGRHRLLAPGLPGAADVEYLVQLPPEYDPYRWYPTIVTLHAATTTPTMQIQWWSGEYDPKLQQLGGQATRHGYIVIAPQWARPRQRRYEYSLREHAAVLACLRDACGRFSVDTDRVFLSGHSMGGDAAWDIGLAHPDVWAGVIPIVAVAYREDESLPQYLAHYWPNAKQVPLYFVTGEKDGNKLRRNETEFNRYMRYAGFDVMVVEYIGRGHEHFYDEIHRLFEWMRLHQRNFLPREFQCASMRPWDSFFWWMELDGLPSRSMLLPLPWSAKPQPVEIWGKVRTQNSILLRSGAEKTILWLTPEMVNFGERLSVDVDGRQVREVVTPSTEVILEDARTRGDRLHPFWAKLEFQGRPR